VEHYFIPFFRWSIIFPFLGGALLFLF